MHTAGMGGDHRNAGWSQRMQMMIESLEHAAECISMTKTARGNFDLKLSEFKKALAVDGERIYSLDCDRRRYSNAGDRIDPGIGNAKLVPANFIYESIKILLGKVLMDKEWQDETGKIMDSLKTGLKEKS